MRSEHSRRQAASGPRSGERPNHSALDPAPAVDRWGFRATLTLLPARKNTKYRKQAEPSLHWRAWRSDREEGYMTPKFCGAVFPLLAACAIANHAAAQPDKAQYELMERCGKRAEEAFRREYGNGISNTETGQNITAFQNHYSATLNKCFFLEIVTSVNYKETPKSISTTMTLLDLNDHKEYGEYFKRTQDAIPFICAVQDKVCHSETEWRELLKPYMED
jgi:hypothetical protein